MFFCFPFLGFSECLKFRKRGWVSAHLFVLLLAAVSMHFLDHLCRFANQQKPWDPGLGVGSEHGPKGQILTTCKLQSLIFSEMV